jgi:hypothetical protein
MAAGEKKKTKNLHPFFLVEKSPKVVFFLDFAEILG